MLYRIEINNVLYCSFYRNPYYVESSYFKRKPKLKKRGRDSKEPKVRIGGDYISDGKPPKRRTRLDNEDEDKRGPKNPKKATFIVTKVRSKDVNVAFRKPVESNLAMFRHSLTITATRTLPIRNT